jgi:hypothetical protein
MDVLRLLGGVGVLRKKLLVTCGLFALVGTIAVAAVLGTATSGKAAATDTCHLVGTQPDCFKVIVSPMFITSGQTGTIDAIFSNTIGTANASHSRISIPLPGGISATKVTTTAPAICSARTENPLVCDFGNVPNGSKVVMRVYITSSVPAGQEINITSTLSFAEGNGSNGNDTFPATGTAESVDGTKKAGYCTVNAKLMVRNKPVPLATATDAGQITTIESLAALAAGDCTPIAAGVEDPPTPGTGIPTTHISIVAFPATGTVTLLFPGRNASSFVLKELSILNGLEWVELHFCSDLIPIVAGTDSCIISETNVTKNGTKYVQDVLRVEGQPPDGHYGG